MNLPEKLSFLRKEKGLSQENLADEMNVTRQAISKWESGNVVPNLDNLICLSKLCGVTIDYLIDDTQDLPPEPESPEPVLTEPNSSGDVISEPVPAESPREKNPTFAFIRKYGLLTAFLLAMVVILILVGCILNIPSQADNQSVPMQDLPTYVVGADEEYSKGTFALDGF